MNDKLNYVPSTGGKVKVYIGKKPIGFIVPVQGGFQYRVKGSSHLHRGEVYRTLAECKTSLVPL